MLAFVHFNNSTPSLTHSLITHSLITHFTNNHPSSHRQEESKVQRVRAYVQLLRIRGSLDPVGAHASAGGSDISIFAMVYYYLRVGMLSHACDEIQQGHIIKSHQHNETL